MSKRNRRNKNVGGGAEEKTPAEVFDTEQDANAALSQVAKVTNIAAKQKEKAAAKAAKAPKVAKDGLPKLPSLPRGSSKPKPLTPCGCGCPLMTRSKFAPGHDSRLRGWALRVARGMLTVAEISEKYGATEGERDTAAAYIKRLKKEGKFEALKLPQVQAKKADKAEAAGE